MPDTLAPLFSILTPTIVRSTLARTCWSLDSQSYRDWEHLIWVDRRPERLTGKQWQMLEQDERRTVRWCPAEHRDFGHGCRADMSRSPVCRGMYILYLDDDDYLADAHVLHTIAEALHGARYPAWAIFPVLREGNYFFSREPGRCRTTLASFVARRTIAQFPTHDPDVTGETVYQLDADLVERLAGHAPPLVLDTIRPLVIIPKPGLGKEE